jgi:hypothetical protein
MRTRRSIFAWPATLAFASFTGLLLGLLGDGAPDYLSWLLLGILPVVTAAGWLRRRRPSSF